MKTIKRILTKNPWIVLFLSFTVYILIVYPKLLFNGGVVWTGDSMPILDWATFLRNYTEGIWQDGNLGIEKFEYWGQLPVYFLLLIIQLLTNYEIASKIQLLLPIICLYFSLYTILTKILNANIFYIFITPLIVSLTGFWIFTVYSGFHILSIAIAFIPLSIYFFLTNQSKKLILLSLTASMTTIPGSFIMIGYYLLLLIGVSYTNIKKLVINMLIVILLATWWIVPTTYILFTRPPFAEGQLSYTEDIIQNAQKEPVLLRFFSNAVDWNTFLSMGANPALTFYYRYEYSIINFIISIALISFFINRFKNKEYKKVNDSLITRIFYLWLCSIAFTALSIVITYIPWFNLFFRSTDRFLWVSSTINITLAVILLITYTRYYTRLIYIILLTLLAYLIILYITLNYGRIPYTIPREYIDLMHDEQTRTMLIPSNKNWYLNLSLYPKINDFSISTSDPLQFVLPQSLSSFTRYENSSYLEIQSIYDSINTNYISENILTKIDYLAINKIVYHKYNVESEIAKNNSLKIIDLLKKSPEWLCTENSIFHICNRVKPLPLVSNTKNLINNCSDYFIIKYCNVKDLVEIGYFPQITLKLSYSKNIYLLALFENKLELISPDLHYKDGPFNMWEIPANIYRDKVYSLIFINTSDIVSIISVFISICSIIIYLQIKKER